MRSFLINKNLSLYYWLKKRIGKEKALRIAKSMENFMLIFGREGAPRISKDGVVLDNRNSRE